jgi:hypothetical protein
LPVVSDVSVLCPGELLMQATPTRRRDVADAIVSRQEGWVITNLSKAAMSDMRGDIDKEDWSHCRACRREHASLRRPSQDEREACQLAASFRGRAP